MKHIRFATTSKEALEAVSFDILIKLNFTDSIVKDATVRRCCDIFRMGATKCSRCIRNGIKMGYLHRDGNDLVAHPLKMDNGYEYILNFDAPTFSYNRTGRSIYTIKDVEERLRRVVLLNHVKMQEQAVDTNIPAPYKHYTNRQLKERARRLKCMSKGYANAKLSMIRIGQIILAGRTKSSKIVNSLVNDGLLTRKTNYKFLASFASLGYNEVKKLCCMASQMSADLGRKVFILPEGLAFRQCNSYGYCGTTIVKRDSNSDSYAIY